MYSKVVLLFDKRDELPTKYKKALQKESISLFSTKSFEDFIKLYINLEPDIVVISDTIESTISLDKVIKKIRYLSIDALSVIIVLSKSNDINDKLKCLEAGADDYFSEPINILEFKARINAHLRRSFENSINEKTRLFNQKVSIKILRRLIKDNSNWACLYININNLKFYEEIYGELAAIKMLQTYTAIIVSTLSQKDYLGHLMNDDYIVITDNIEKAENLAKYFVFAFDKVVEKFYNENDTNQGFIITGGDIKSELKLNLVTTSIGIISNYYKQYTDIKSLLTQLIYINKLSRLKSGSNYITECPKIETATKVLKQEYNNKILIVEPDESMSILLQTTLNMKGYKSKVIDYDDLINYNFNKYLPAVIILDAGNGEDLIGIKLCKTIKDNNIDSKTKIILTTIFHEKQKILNAGADLYLPKPYELTDLFLWIQKFISEYNNT